MSNRRNVLSLIMNTPSWLARIQRDAARRLKVETNGCHHIMSAHGEYTTWHKPVDKARLAYNIDGKVTAVSYRHVVAWLLCGGPVQRVENTCHNGNCCNPDHLSCSSKIPARPYEKKGYFTGPRPPTPTFYQTGRFKNLQTMFNYRFLHALRNRPGLTETVDFDKTWWFEEVHKDCHYCGLEASHDPRGHHGLDRADNAKGYTKDNVVPCCRRCNRVKGVLSKDEFIALCRKISERL